MSEFEVDEIIEASSNKNVLDLNCSQHVRIVYNCQFGRKFYIEL